MLRTTQRAMASDLAAGAECWVPDRGDEGFVRAKLINLTAEEATVQAGGGQATHKVADVFPVNPSNQSGCKDNTELMYLREPHMLFNLKERYRVDAIYTYTAHILIACNPFKRLQIYSTEKMLAYAGKPLGVMEPHVFAVADRAFRQMAHYGQSQAVIISGESGSGKTETAKVVMSYLTWSGGGDPKTKEKKGRKSFSDISALAQRVLQANPLLESFGNARTLRNDNSSRFGKFTKMLFGSAGAIEGAAVSTYLLEKSRLVTHAPGERGYHVFYELCAGANKAQRAELKLLPARDYPFLFCDPEKEKA